MNRIEYKTMTYTTSKPDRLIIHLNMEGAEGWQVVHIDPSHTTGVSQGDDLFASFFKMDQTVVYYSREIE